MSFFDDDLEFTYTDSSGDTTETDLSTMPTIVRISTRLFVTDIGFGGYLSKRLGESTRVYVGAGPLIQFGEAKFEDQFGSDHDSGFGVGGYVRGGVEWIQIPR